MLRALILGIAAVAVGAASAQAEATLRIGVIEDLSGLYADIVGHNPEAARMAVEDFGGQVLGRPIEVIQADHQNKPDIGSATARRWYDEGVSMITGLGNSAVGLAVRKVAEEKKKIDINISAGSVDLTGKACSPTGFHWVFDTYAMAKVIGTAVVKSGGDSWFFLTSDYAFGHALERDTIAVVQANGGKVLGAVRHPLNTADFSSFLLQAQGSKAKIIGLANAGGDTVNSIKQAGEFGIGTGSQKMAALLAFVTDVNALGLKTAQGLYLAESFYWDMDDASRAWAKRMFDKRKAMPNMNTAGTYSAVTHYLKAVKAAGTDDAEKVAAKMKELPVEDFYTHGAKIREDGRVLRDMHLFQVKTPAESKAPWDYYKLIATLKGEEAWRPLAEGGCPYVKAH